MRLHSDKITEADIHAATRNLPGVYATVTAHGSRSRQQAFEVRLEGNGSHRNSGRYGSDTYSQAATWDEWGAVMGYLYGIDPHAVWGPSEKNAAYNGVNDFDFRTGDRFDASGTLPSDTHKRHNWEYVPVREAYCTRCSAVKRG